MQARALLEKIRIFCVPQHKSIPFPTKKKGSLPYPVLILGNIPHPVSFSNPVSRESFFSESRTLIFFYKQPPYKH